MRIAETPAKVLLVTGALLLVLGQTCEESARDLAVEPECAVDDDCTLMPSQMTCCGECDPAPPFEAVPRTAVDSRLLSSRPIARCGGGCASRRSATSYRPSARHARSASTASAA